MSKRERILLGICMLSGAFAVLAYYLLPTAEEEFQQTFSMVVAPFPLPMKDRYDVKPLRDMLTAEIAIKSQQPDAAIPYYLSLAKEVDNVEVTKRGLELALASHNYNAAFQFSMRWQAQEPTNPQIKTLSALLLLQQPQLALNLLNEALTKNPQDTELLYSRALIEIQLQKYADAQHDLEQLLVANPKDAKVLNALGYILADQNEQLTQALQYINQAYQIHPHDPAILDSMGWVHFRMGKYSLAEKYLRQAYVKNSDSGIAAHLIQTLLAQGKNQDAKQIWTAASKAAPNHSELDAFTKQFGAR